MRTIKIDLNCDVGEGMPNEKELFPYLSSCSIACGGHFGDAISMQQIIVLAKQNNVKIGAHPSYPDKENFGRKSISIPDATLIQSIKSQLINFVAVAKSEDVKIHHIKPHGALYNNVAKDFRLAEVFLHSIEKYKNEAYLYVPYASVVSKLAVDQGFNIKNEVFADRNYNDDYSLVSRKLPNAVISSKEKVVAHVLKMVNENKIIVESGTELPVIAETLCLHGDNPNALEIIKYLNIELPKPNITIQK